MAIQPPSDIVLDVARAADPLEYHASIEKLRIAQNAVRTPDSASVSVNEKADFANLVRSDLVPPKEVVHQVHIKSRAINDKNSEVFKDFEAFMLQTLIENMFTTDLPSVFGKGQAGKIWKFMMVEQLAKEFAMSGGIGIAQMLASEQEKKTEGLLKENLSHEKELKQTLVVQDYRTIADVIVHANELNLVRQHR
ncbi:hypothetical protein H704_01045 [Bartonella bacilliformis Peru38]|uniref:Flagellar protein FlgJ N-terminal domain-containing protein n=2 Tax=Bartonella bacilliformis TaxID=774 RepID=A1UTW3_BARBK|nr:rod-binding protein [Bartonella bacilliformis]ABM45508.1 conserved hypothetical protein [Bartonella bacilliformis KC583]AMG86160.1 hypothetical protein AL467_05475 [Bartonella bacilliformis]EKS43054.1 hypothetical protein BbINS_05447 [Bartonella bacilliformis INS]EYS88606.1 hypothetical protein X472_01157 [Bartonella bacilliformis San Pedro600-02]EYS94416.1 hypothetical protein X470_01120 [Bartonella bacilliformis Peru-18]